MSEAAPLWRSPPPTLTPSAGAVHVWRAHLDQPQATVARLYATLAADEQQRAARFHFAHDRDHFVVARGLLRAILGRYLGCAPHRLRFTYSAYGKPDLALETGGAELRFNLSHSAGLALYVVALGQAVGIDVERVRPDLASDAIARRFFAPREVAALQALPSETRTAAFFTCWTRKEAYIKAHGAGLSLALDRFAVSLDPAEAALLETLDDPAEAARWRLYALDPGPGYAAACAVAGVVATLDCWDCPAALTP